MYASVGQGVKSLVGPRLLRFRLHLPKMGGLEEVRLFFSKREEGGPTALVSSTGRPTTTVMLYPVLANGGRCCRIFGIYVRVLHVQQQTRLRHYCFLDDRRHCFFILVFGPTFSSATRFILLSFLDIRCLFLIFRSVCCLPFGSTVAHRILRTEAALCYTIDGACGGIPVSVQHVEGYTS